MAQLGIIDATEGILVSETLNDALEYAETEILTTAGGKHAVVLKPLESGKRHHLADIDRGSYLGELSFLNRRFRSADAEVKEDVEFFAHLALVIAERLRQTDIELEALEER